MEKARQARQEVQKRREEEQRKVEEESDRKNIQPWLSPLDFRRGKELFLTIPTEQGNSFCDSQLSNTGSRARLKFFGVMVEAVLER
jgi:hypothetical protein